jgi:hypothetical protein
MHHNERKVLSSYKSRSLASKCPQRISLVSAPERDVTDTRYHFIKDLVNNKEISLEFSRSKEKITDIFTKALARDAF